MEKTSETWNGEWWMPCNEDEQPLKFSGTLTCDEYEKPILKLLASTDVPHSSLLLISIQPILYGTDTRGEKYSLFNVRILSVSASSVTYSADYFVTGAHIKSLDDKCFIRASVYYPNLKQWIFYNRLFAEETDEATKLLITNVPPANTLSVEVEDGLSWNFRSQLHAYQSEYEWHFIQDTSFGICPSQKISLNQVFQHAIEFSQFLSVAMLSKQAPSYIFLWTEDTEETHVKLLFKQERSAGVFAWHRLIRAYELQEKMPTILKQWHTIYERIAPICTYLINSLEGKDNFGAPDFLIVAQALDGYSKRFFNDDTKKKHLPYKEKIEKLLKCFEKIDIVKACKIQPKVLADTRNQYSHLALDGEEECAVSSQKELRELTTKAQILHICCLLNSMGLNDEEINACFNGTSLKNWI